MLPLPPPVVGYLTLLKAFRVYFLLQCKCTQSAMHCNVYVFRFSELCARPINNEHALNSTWVSNDQTSASNIT